MRHFTTVCDSKYLSQGLALYDSLIKVNPDFILYWGCMDKETFDYVLKLPNVRPFTTKDIFAVNDFSYKEYAWSLASRFTWWILEGHEMDSITYLDADLYFYQDYEIIFKEIGEKSVGLVEHRIPNYKTVGKYNVGFVYFKNDEAGRECLNSWQKMVANKKNYYFETHGQCGDQAYLSLFLDWHPLSVHIIESGHGAWWNNRWYTFKDDYIIWNGQKQLFVYMHFSHFKLTKDGYTHDEMIPLEKPEWKRLKEYYDNYEKEVRKHEKEV